MSTEDIIRKVCEWISVNSKWKPGIRVNDEGHIMFRFTWSASQLIRDRRYKLTKKQQLTDLQLKHIHCWMRHYPQIICENLCEALGCDNNDMSITYHAAPDINMMLQNRGIKTHVFWVDALINPTELY